MKQFSCLKIVSLTGLLLSFSLGCVHLWERPAGEMGDLHYQVKCGGDCLQLPSGSAADGSALLSKIDEHLANQRYASLDKMLQRRLDVGIETLRQRDSRRAPSEAELALARAVDACLGHEKDDGWQARLLGRSCGLDRAEGVLTRAQGFVRNQQWEKARELLQKNQTHLSRYPYHAIYGGLILAETQRCHGQFEIAVQTWQQTVVMAAQVSERWLTPGLWEQLAGQRPVSTPWPAQVARLSYLLPDSLRQLPQMPNFATEALVWYAIGNAHLQRGDASAALTAFKRADSQRAFPGWDDFLNLHEAKALLALQQAPAATSVLTTLAGRTDAPWRLPALALLGSVKLHEGHTQQALAFLRPAVEEFVTPFFCRAEAEADLALVYLSTGNEAKGLPLLHAAQEHLQQEGHVEVLLTSLENEARYLTQIGRREDAHRVQQRVRELQQLQGPG